MNPINLPNSAQSILFKVINENTNTLTNLKQGFTRAFNMTYYGVLVVNQSTQPLPIEIVQGQFDLLGSQGVPFFQKASATIDLITSNDPSFVAPVPPYLPAFNQDGTVTFSVIPTT